MEIDKQKKANIVVGSIIGLLVIVGITFLPIWGDDENSNNVTVNTSVPTITQDENFSIEDMTSFNKEENYEETEEVDDAKTSLKADELLNRIAQGDNNEVYNNENDPIALEMQRQIELLEKEREALKQNPVYTSTPVTTDSKPKETRAEYLERLKKAREEYERKQNEKNVKSVKPIKKTITAVVYGDQYLLPGDRLELALPNDLIINGKTYVKGTPVFAYITINRSRVILDINNIEGDRMGFTSEDYWDHRVGIYSKRAGELWREYEQEQKQKASNQVAEEVSDKTGSPIIGTAITDITTFFRQKKIRKDQKILLLNNHKVTLHINTIKL